MVFRILCSFVFCIYQVNFTLLLKCRRSLKSKILVSLVSEHFFRLLSYPALFLLERHKFSHFPIRTVSWCHCDKECDRRANMFKHGIHRSSLQSQRYKRPQMTGVNTHLCFKEFQNSLWNKTNVEVDFKQATCYIQVMSSSSSLSQIAHPRDLTVFLRQIILYEIQCYLFVKAHKGASVEYFR